MYWGIVCPLYGISLFLPTIIKELGYTSSTAQLLTVPIYITAAVLAVVVGFLSDRATKRGASRWPYIFVPMCAILVGFVVAISGSAAGDIPGVVYAGVFIAVCGIYPAFPGNVTWIANNLAGSYKRSAGMALQVSTPQYPLLDTQSFIVFRLSRYRSPKLTINRSGSVIWVAQWPVTSIAVSMRRSTSLDMGWR